MRYTKTDLKLRHQQVLFPSKPIFSRNDLAEPAESGQARSRVLALENHELLPNDHIGEPKAATRVTKAKKRGQKEPDRV